MKIGEVQVKKIKRMFGVDVPVDIRNNPQKALAYVAGYTCTGRGGGRGSFSDEMQNLAQIIDGAKSPFLLVCGTIFGVKSNFVNAFWWGYAAAGKSYKIPRGGFYKNRVEHEKDLVELMELAERNPSLIPHWAWPDRNDNKEHRSGRQYHFG